VRLAVDAVRRRPGRSAATVLGIGLATGLVVMLLALSEGIQGSATHLAAASGIDLLATSANTSLSTGTFPAVDSAHTLVDALERADPNVATASPWLVGALTYANASLFAAVNSSAAGAPIPSGWAPSSAGSVGWIPSANVGLETPRVIDGPGFDSAGDPHYGNGSYQGPFTHATELDQGLAGLLGVGVGDLVWVSPRSVAGPSDLSGWFANATAFQVVGVTTSFWLIPSALLGFFYLSEFQALSGYSGAAQDYASLVLIHLRDASAPSRDQALLAAVFPDLTLFTIGNVLGVIADAVNLYRTFGTLVGGLALVVATLFTTTVLLMSVDDRSREIALFRAVGFARGRIGLLIVEEGLLLAGLGLVVGLGIGAAGAYALNGFLVRQVGGLPNGFSFVAFDSTVVASGLTEVLLIGLLASIGPAWRAMSSPVAEELRAP